MRKALYILAELDDQDLVWLAEAGQCRLISTATVLIEKNQIVDALYIILDGKLEVRATGQTKIAELAVGDIIGEMSLIEKRPPSVSVVAISPVKVLVVPLEKIRQRLKDDSAFAARFYHALAIFLSDRLRTTMTQLGYGDENPQTFQQRFEEEHALDEGVLDTLSIAGDRMRRLINLLEGLE